MPKMQIVQARWAWTVFLILTGFVMLVTFQNCSNPAAESTKATDYKTEFLYDAKLDQIAYMSCSQMQSSKASDADIAAYASFRVGAYRTGGIKVKDEWFEDNLKKRPAKMSSLLSNSAANVGTIPQVALRKISNLNSMITSSGSPVKDMDFGNLLGELGTQEMNDNLVATGFNETNKSATGKRIRYLRSGFATGARFEANLYFGSSEGIAKDVRDNQLGTGSVVLALTFVEPQNSSTDTNVRNDYTVWPDEKEENWTKAYGMRYNLNFAKPSGAKGRADRESDGDLKSPYKELEGYPTSHLMSVTEKNLNDPSDTTGLKSWTCDPAKKFKIVRPEDITEAGCVRAPDPATLSEFQQIVRHSFRTEDFYIDWTNKCLIPKKGAAGCYGSNVYVRYNYTNNEGCDPNSVEGTNSTKSRACLAWASVCTRDN